MAVVGWGMATTVILVASFLAVFGPALALLIAGLARLAVRPETPLSGSR